MSGVKAIIRRVSLSFSSTDQVLFRDSFIGGRLLCTESLFSEAAAEVRFELGRLDTLRPAVESSIIDQLSGIPVMFCREATFIMRERGHICQEQWIATG